ncbi:hypothetical protein TNCV_1475371 [Trichonephila clavipes]|nr:hypothetical protein TNCV_1475371 [Trichonephila clavipes]
MHVPTKQLASIPAHTLIRKWCRLTPGLVLCGLYTAHMRELECIHLYRRVPPEQWTRKLIIPKNGNGELLPSSAFYLQFVMTPRGPCYTATYHEAQITTQGNDGASRRVSKRTLQRSLHRIGFGSRLPTRVPLFNYRQRAARLAWARENRD